MAGTSDANQLWGWERFFGELGAFMRLAELQEGTANESFAEYVVERLETCIRNVSVLVEHLRAATDNQEAAITATRYSALLAQLCECLQRLSLEWESYLDQYQLDVLSTSYMAPVIPRSQIGRPRFLITEHQLEYLRSMSFSWVRISEILGVSCMTIYRRRQEYGMTGIPTGTLTDAELHMIVHHMQTELPALGQTMVWGRLRSMGFFVTRERVRRAIHDIDPIHTALQWRCELVHHHPYSVPGPNSLWHIGEFLLV